MRNNEQLSWIVQCLVKSRRMQAPKPIYSYLSAATLAVVTLFTFYVFRDFGPQSVIRRFHFDIARGDYQDARSLILQGGSPNAIDRVIQDVDILARSKASFEIVGLRRSKNTVLAEVQYTNPQGFGETVVWCVLQTQTDWRIDCDATIRANRPKRPRDE